MFLTVDGARSRSSFAVVRVLATACWLALFSVAAYAQDPAAPGGQQDPGSATSAAEPQDNEVETLDTVLVTGIRHSIATSVETKNESNSIVEAISRRGHRQAARHQHRRFASRDCRAWPRSASMGARR